MSVISAVTGPSPPQDSQNRSSIGGIGTGASFDSSASSVIQLSGRLQNAFRDSFLRFDKVINKAVNTRDNLDDIRTIVSRTVVLARNSANPTTNDSNRQTLQNDFRRNLRNIEKILTESKKNDIDLRQDNALRELYADLGIDLDTRIESSSNLRRFTGIQLGSVNNTNTRSVFAQNILTEENAKSALNILERFERNLDKDIRSINNDIDALKKANDLSFKGFILMNQADVSGANSIDQLSLRLGIELRAKTSDFLISTNSKIDRDAIQAVLN